MSLDKKKVEALRIKFTELCKQDADDQMEFFLKSFIFALDERWKEVSALRQKFAKYLKDLGSGAKDLNFVQAADFLQKNGKTRIAQQIKDELADIDLDDNKAISFIEYLCLHYKAMILIEFYKRTETKPTEDLSEDAVGVVGVGEKILDELFYPKVGLPPELIEAIEAFTAKKKELEAKRKDLEGKAAQGGVKGNAAANELAQLDAADRTAMNKQEVTLDAARRKALKTSSDVALEKKKKAEEAERKKAEEDARAKMAERRKAFESAGTGTAVHKDIQGFNANKLKKTNTVDKSKPATK
jgi:hypothetical protein